MRRHLGTAVAHLSRAHASCDGVPADGPTSIGERRSLKTGAIAQMPVKEPLA